MKKIININLSGRLIPIEDSAYEILQAYLDSLKRYFAKEEGGDEIVADIESRISEIFQDKLKKGAHCITDEDVDAVKASMGTPEQFDDEPKTGAESPEPEYFSGRPRKRLYRDPDHKVLGGVCGGLGAYFNIDPVIFRIIMALLAIGAFGTGILVYFILWIATPEANTAAEKLEMRGERVDLNNIKTTIQDELNQMKSSMKNVGQDFKNFSQGRGKQVGSDIENFFHQLFSGIGRVLLFLAKGFFYFVVVVLLFCLVITGVMVAIFSAALFPLKSLMLSGGMQNTLFWPAIVLVLGIPVVALIFFIIRKLTGVKQTNKYAGSALAGLWFLGLIFTVIVSVSLVKDFRSYHREKEVFTLQQPSHGKLIVQRDNNTDGVPIDEDVDMFDGHLRLSNDYVMIEDIRVRMIKSQTDSFSVEVYRSGRGRNERAAREVARQIEFRLNQQDSILYLPASFTIPRNANYRAQRVVVVIKVPVGKNIEIQKDAYHHYDWHYNGVWNDRWDNDHDWDDDWDYSSEDSGPVELKMTIDGLNDIHAKPRQKDTIPVEKNIKAADSTGVYRYRYQQPASNTPVEESGSTTKPAAGSETSMVLYSMFKVLSS